jgi:hypothetical protein
MFTAATLKVSPVAASSTFPGWHYGQANPGNLLGTIRGQDGQSVSCGGARPTGSVVSAVRTSNWFGLSGVLAQAIGLV